LFELQPELPELGTPVLIHALDGFVDAGGATRLARAHLLDTRAHEVVASFDVDQLLDYRARRPEMIFETNHWQAYTPPELTLHALSDAAGTPFLLLSGPEPDVQWERFAAAIELLVRELGVRMLVGFNAIPMGVPHTRPASVIVHGTPPSLVADYDAWLGTVKVPASAGHLIEFRLGEAGVDSMGFAVNVPHYVAHLDYPPAAIKLLESAAAATGLLLPTDELAESANAVRASIDEQVAASTEVSQVVKGLEQQYDAIVAGRASSLLADGASLPTANEIGAEFERYLAQQPRPDEQ